MLYYRFLVDIVWDPPRGVGGHAQSFVTVPEKETDKGGEAMIQIHTRRGVFIALLGLSDIVVI